MYEEERELAEMLAERCTSLREVEEVIRQLFKSTIERMLETEMDEFLGYGKNDTSGNNSGNSRNGYNRKTVQSDFGKVEIRIPRDRNGEFKPEVIEKYQKKTENLDDRIIEMYAKGMSNKDIEEHLRSMYGVDVSASLISKITDKTIPAAQKWQDRPLKETYPIVYFTEMAFKTKKDGKVTDTYVCTVLGIDADGIKDILGMWIDDGAGGAGEDILFRMHICGELKERGLKNILVVCHEGLNGLSAAISETFPKAEKQICIIHQVSNSTKYVLYKDRKEITADLKGIYSASAADEAEYMLEEFKEKWDGKYPQVSQAWEENWSELTAFFKYPDETRHIIYTTNIAKGFQRMLRKLTKAKAVYPGKDALQKSLYLSITEITKKWNKPLPSWDAVTEQLAASPRFSLAGMSSR